MDSNLGGDEISPEPITRRTLHSEVLERLRDMIIDGRLPAGSRLNEGVIGKQLGVSRTPLREAAKTLASEGLLEIVPAKGAYVRSLSEEDVSAILDIIKLLEQHAGRQTCAIASEAEVRHILALHEEMRIYFEKRDRMPYFKLNQAIHTAIIQGAHNQVLADMHAQLQARIKRARYVGNSDDKAWQGAFAEHEEMARALKLRNGDALADALGRHLDATWQRVRGQT